MSITARPTERWGGVADGLSEVPRSQDSTARRRASRPQTSRAGPAGRVGTLPMTPAPPGRGRRGRRRPGRSAWRSLLPLRLAAPRMLIGGTSPSTTAWSSRQSRKEVDDGLTASRARPLGLVSSFRSFAGQLRRLERWSAPVMSATSEASPGFVRRNADRGCMGCEASERRGGAVVSDRGVAPGRRGRRRAGHVRSVPTSVASRGELVAVASPRLQTEDDQVTRARRQLVHVRACVTWVALHAGTQLPEYARHLWGHGQVAGWRGTASFLCQEKGHVPHPAQLRPAAIRDDERLVRQCRTARRCRHALVGAPIPQSRPACT